MFCKNCGNEIIDNTKFCTKCGRENYLIKTKDTQFIIKKNKRLLLVLGSILIILSLSFWVYFENTPNQNKLDQIQNDIASVVVNIVCEGSNGWDDTDQVSGGSGTIITPGGLVLTNSHIIPQGKDESKNDKSCLVILPDPTSGASKEIYYAKPLVVPDISEKYDLAFVQIDDVYYDQEEGVAYGEFPKVFDTYDDEKYCKNNEEVKLGESVRIYGYPAISGGYTLTITEGIVSTLLPQEGLIITSAKVSHGNSGGLAVDQYGCRIGIPSMVSGDNYESLGVIISNDLIADFTDELRIFLKNNP